MSRSVLWTCWEWQDWVPRESMGYTPFPFFHFSLLCRPAPPLTLQSAVVGWCRHKALTWGATSVLDFAVTRTMRQISALYKFPRLRKSFAEAQNRHKVPTICACLNISLYKQSKWQHTLPPGANSQVACQPLRSSAHSQGEGNRPHNNHTMSVLQSNCIKFEQFVNMPAAR